jgi:hypothetical protein
MSELSVNKVVFPSGDLLGPPTTATDNTSNRVLRHPVDPFHAFRRGNILGTVSQSGGTPTGAIIERGSNSNGEFVRFADGTQICLRTASLTATAVTNAPFYYTTSGDEITWTYPASFISTPMVMGSCTSANLAFFGSSRAVGSTSAVLQAIADRSRTASTFSYSAIGRWY